MCYPHFCHILEPSADAIENFDALLLLEPLASNLVFESASLANFHDNVNVLIGAENVFLAHQKWTWALSHLTIEFLHHGDLTEENGFEGLLAFVKLSELNLLKGYILLGLKIVAPEHLAEAAFAQHVVLVIGVLALLEALLHV